MCDWQAGDMAVAIQGIRGRRGGPDDFTAPGCSSITIGGVYTVERVVHWHGMTGLVIEGHYSIHKTRSWRASSFLKVTPPQADEFDREVIEQMKPVEVVA